MGFFSKLADAMTGGWVKVHLQWSDPVLGKPIQVRVNADTVKSDKDIDGVYVQVVAEEKVTIPRVHVAETVNGVVQERSRTSPTPPSPSTRSFRSAGRSRSRRARATSGPGSSPSRADARPTFLGLNSGHTWRIMAGLEVKGNDPDSGWSTITMVR